jgi:topoisomerase-4 subunit A
VIESENHKSLAAIPGSIANLYQDYYLNYASYVILDRAIPNINDGLKPVQRRILHSLEEMDDGRYNKVANVIGHCMRYHPHGDASIGDAMINLGQKELLIDTQGNWGNILTGDRAAAPRYIEARLTKFAKTVAFKKEITEWEMSYDGRGKEPVNLPIKFPLLLFQGAEGIAVGLATKILPHNFNELIDASISALRNEEFDLIPDFPSGGIADASEYKGGLRGGKIKIRARIETAGTNLLKITEIPFETTTQSVIDSIVSASEKGKLKIKKIEDNTAKDVDIQITLPSGSDPAKVRAALFAFTKCEVSVSPNSCVIDSQTPVFNTVNKILIHNAFRTKDLLKQELEIKRDDLQEKIFFSSLESIFIENKVYRTIENCETWKDVISTIKKKMKPHTKGLLRELTEDDATRLTEIKIKRISKFDSDKANDKLVELEGELEVVIKNLKSLTKFTISYFKKLKKDFGKDFTRKTEITTFKEIDKTKVAAANKKVYLNAKDGFIGTSLRKEEFLFECSDLDEIICVTQDGLFKVVRASDKSYIGKNIIYAAVFKRGDNNTTYNLIYRDGRIGNSMIKRFHISSITRDKEYDLTKGTKGTKVLHFGVCKSAEEQEVVYVKHAEGQKLKNKVLGVDFLQIPIKGRATNGNILTRYKVAKVDKKK